MKKSRQIRTTREALAWIRTHQSKSLLLAAGVDGVFKWIASWQFSYASDTSLIRAVDALRRKVDAL